MIKLKAGSFKVIKEDLLVPNESGYFDYWLDLLVVDADALPEGIFNAGVEEDCWYELDNYIYLFPEEYEYVED